MGDFTRVKSPMKIHGRFYLSKKTPDYKMTHQLFTLFWIISNILTFHFYTFSVIYTFYFYIAFEELTFYQKCSIKCVLYSLFYARNVVIARPDLYVSVDITILHQKFWPTWATRDIAADSQRRDDLFPISSISFSYFLTPSCSSIVEKE